MTASNHRDSLFPLGPRIAPRLRIDESERAQHTNMDIRQMPFAGSDFSIGDSPAITAGDLHQALIDNQLKVHYQPLVDMKTGRVRSVEALLRWKHPHHGNLNPESIINLAEQSGLIGPLTDWVLATALKASSEWQKQGWSFRIAVNAAPSLLLDSGFADRVAALIEKSGTPPENLILEVTEGRFVAERVDVLETLARLRLAGVSLAIDDFGTGYSSLGRLHSLPFTELKIDKSLVMETSGDPRQELVMRAIAQLGRGLGLTVVAEGVSGQEAWELARSTGCDLAQGYFVSRPLPADTLTEWLHHRDAPDTSTAQEGDHLHISSRAS